jgi:hypothetical protein
VQEIPQMREKYKLFADSAGQTASTVTRMEIKKKNGTRCRILIRQAQGKP